MSKSKSTQRIDQTTTQTPQVPGWIAGPYQSYASNVQGLLGTDPSSYLTGATTNQSQAWQRAGQANPNTGLINQGLGAMQGQLGVDPLLDVSPYLNPYTDAVVDASLRDVDLQRQRAIAQGQGAATQAGAFGGSRHGVADSLTNEAALREGGLLASGLRERGYTNAQNAAMQSAAYRTSVAEALARLGLQSSADRRADIDQLANLGGQERAVNSSLNPNVARIDLLQAIGGLLGQVPSNTFTGQTGHTQGTTTTTQSGSFLDTLGRLASLGSTFVNPFKIG